MKKTRRILTRAVEALESRLYRDGAPWAWNATMIHQDQAVADFPLVTGAGQTVVILDTGLDENNATFNGKSLTAWQDFIGNSTDPVDVVGHGTGVYGVLAGAHFDFEGVQDQGVAPGVNVIMLRTDDEDNNTSWSTEAQRISNALDWVIANKDTYNIVAVNMSTGGPTGFTDPSTPGDPDDAIDQTLRTKFATLAGEGVFLVAASGNDGDGTQSPLVAPNTVEYPAADPNVYAVSSVDVNGDVSSYASRGVLTDLMAPGENIFMPFGGAPGSFIDFGTGTSFSAPAVTAAGALLKQINPNFTPAQIIQILQDSGTPVTDSVTGNSFEIMNLDAAIKLAYSEADDLDNHTLGTATALTFTNDTAGLSGLTSLVGTHDYYSFTLTHAAQVTFSVSTTTGDTLNNFLVDSGGTTITNLTGGKTLTLLPGTYYVRVDGDSTTTLNGTYSVSLSKTDTTDLNNHTLQTAVPIDLSSGSGEIDDILLTANQPDFYSISIGANSSVTLNLTSDGAYPTVTLLDSNGNALADVPSNGLTRDLNPGTYYISVQSATSVTYSISASLTSAATPGQHATVVSTAYDSAGNMHMAYFDGSTHTLQYAVRDHTTRTWSVASTVDPTIGAGTQLSIAIDNNDEPAIAYYASGTGDLKFAHFNGSTWDITTVDYYKTTGLTPSMVYRNDGTPLIAYYDQYFGQLRVASLVNGRWSIYTVDTGGVGKNADITYDSSLNVYGIGYENVKTGALKYATYYRRAFRTSTIDATTTGGVSGISMAINDVTHNPAVAYYDVGKADLVYAAFTGRRWSITHVATRNNQGQYNSLAFTNGVPDIVYYAPTYNAINNAALSNGVWGLTRIVSGGVGMVEAYDNLNDDTLAWVDGNGVEFFDFT